MTFNDFQEKLMVSKSSVIECKGHELTNTGINPITQNFHLKTKYNSLMNTHLIN